MKYKVTVTEYVTEQFDIIVEIPDDTCADDINDVITEAAEDRRVNGNDKREFLEISEVDFNWEDAE